MLNSIGESVSAGPGPGPALQQVEVQHSHCGEGAARPQHKQGHHSIFNSLLLLFFLFSLIS